ncbi:MAG: hypothetical protein ACKOW9_05015 [Candidatus Paceibacterota bacterium]
MDVFSFGLTTILNGVITLIINLASPLVIVTVLLFISFLWLCLIELDEVDRQGTKPEVMRH